MKRVLIFLVSLFLGVSGAIAQAPTAVILGAVTDASGAAVAGAKVSVRNTGTDQVRIVETNQDGAYRLDALPVGNYEITAEVAGFKRITQTGITLTVAQQAVENFSMQIGDTTQTVSVTAEAPLVETTTSASGGLVDSQRIVDLPLNGRNYIDLTLLQPGVTKMQLNRGYLGLYGTMFVSNGAPPASNNYMLDGANMRTLAGTNSASITGNTLGVDGILEYRVINSNLPAEYGGTMGSQMVMVSKGGTNQFHGDAFEFLRNSSLDARNFFDLPPSQLGGKRLPEFRRNNFGGAFGGPIQKDKTFFFAVYEGLSQSLGTTNTVAVPVAGCHGAANAVITVAACPAIGPSSSSVTIAPQMAPILALYPLANINASSPAANQFGFGFNQLSPEHYGQFRLDHSLSASDNLFARYTIDHAATALLAGFVVGPLISLNQFATLSENHVFSQSLLNTARFSFDRTDPVVGQSPDSPIGPQYSFNPGQPLGTVIVTGLYSLSTPSSQELKQTIYSYSDDLTYTRGRHSLKFGASYNHYQFFFGNFGGTKGTATFGGIGLQLTPMASFLTGNVSGFAYSPLGSIYFRNYRYNTMGFYGQDDWRVTSRLTLNLGLRYEPTTSYTEINGYSASIHNILTDNSTTIGPPFRNPSLRNWSPRVGFAWDVFGDGKTAVRGGFDILYDLTSYGFPLQTATSFTPPFDPVVNFVVPTGTVIAPGTSNFSIPYVVPPGVTIANSYRGPDYNIKQSYIMTFNLAVERQLPGSMSLTVGYVGTRGIHLLQSKEGNPTIPNGVPSNGLCVGAAGASINFANQFDGTATSCFLAGALRQNAYYAKINNTTATPWGSLLPLTQSGGQSWYNAMDVVLNKRLTKGFQIQSSFTYSSLFDTGSGAYLNEANGSTTYKGLDDLHSNFNRGPSDFAQQDVWRVNAIYHLPNFTSSKGFMDKVANGWWTSGIYSLASGYPMEAFVGSNRSANGEPNGGMSLFELPSVVPGRNNSNITHGVSSGCPGVPAGTPLGTPQMWFDPCAFYVQPAGFLGNEPRNGLRGPALQNLDFSIVKDTAAPFLGEAGKIEFRAEFFNIFNHPNFGVPAVANAAALTGACTAPATAACGPSTANPTGASVLSSAGQLSVEEGTSRQIQFGLKILF
jgi:hypothetical protein